MFPVGKHKRLWGRAPEISPWASGAAAAGAGAGEVVVSEEEGLLRLRELFSAGFGGGGSGSAGGGGGAREATPPGGAAAGGGRPSKRSSEDMTVVVWWASEEPDTREEGEEEEQRPGCSGAAHGLSTTGLRAWIFASLDLLFFYYHFQISVRKKVVPSILCSFELKMILGTRIFIGKIKFCPRYMIFLLSYYRR